MVVWRFHAVPWICMRFVIAKFPDHTHYFCNFYLGEEEKAGCFALIVFQVSCDCQCALPLPNGIVGWSAVCECGISRS